MKYLSTRGNRETYDDLTVILEGLAPDGGLFVPETIPELEPSFFDRLIDLDYADRAAEVLGLFFPSFSQEELTTICRKVYNPSVFDPEPAPLTRLNPFDPSLQMLELWHGPTAAFKDLALQLLPELQALALKKKGVDQRFLILTATSGDTGTAALEAFKDNDAFAIAVLYPKHGVAALQELQMITAEGEDSEVIAIEGDFDAAQRTVKELFADVDFNAEMDAIGLRLSSANSINWARLVAQMVYYVSGYVKLLGGEGNHQASQWYDREDEHRKSTRHEEAIEAEKEKSLDHLAIPFDVCVPSGNFGNILAAWYAKQMGVPIRQLICASNRNNVLTQFFQKGIYSPGDKLHRTTSPSMDILVSSNLERLLFELTKHNAEKICQWMDELREDGQYKIDERTFRRTKKEFRAAYARDKAVERSIREVYHRFDHIIDPHTAVAFEALKQVHDRQKETYPCIIVSTASPYKFPDTVVNAIFGPKRVEGLEPHELQARIERESDMPIPDSLLDLTQKPVRHTTQLSPDQVREHLLERFGSAERAEGI